MLAQSNYECINSKNNEVSYLHFDQLHAPRFTAFTDTVNQSRLSASRNPTIGITGLIVGYSIMHHLVFLDEDVGCPGAIALIPVASAVLLAQIHVLAVAVLAFPFPVGRHKVRRHCHWRHWRHWRHWLHCRCLFLMSKLHGLVSYPVPILWIVFCNTGGMRHEVVSTRQCHILVALCETIRHQSRCCDVIANAHRQC